MWRDQLVDFSVGDLGQNAVAFADGQQDGIQHGVDAAHNLGIRAAKLLWLAALGELSVPRGIGQAQQFLLQALHDDSHVVDGLFHLFVIALVGVGNQLVDLSVGDLGENAVALADGQQNRIQHLVDALHHLAMYALKLVGLAALVEMAQAGRLYQAQDLLGYPVHLQVGRF